MIYLSSSIGETASSFIANGDKRPDYGLLIGTDGPCESTYVFNIVYLVGPVDLDGLIDRALAIRELLPGNVDILGLAVFNEDKQNPSVVEDIQRFGYGLTRSLNSDGIWALFVNFDALLAKIDFGSSIGDARWYDAGSGRLNNDIVPTTWKRSTDMLSRFVTIRMTTSIPWQFNCPETWNADDIEEEIRRYYDRYLSNSFTEKPYLIGFRNGGQLIAMLGMGEANGNIWTKGLEEDSTVWQLFNVTTESSKRKDLFLHQDVIDCCLLEKASSSEYKHGALNGDHETKIVPIVQYEASNFLHFDIPLNFQLMIVCGQQTKLSELPALFHEAFRRAASIHMKKFLQFSELSAKRLRILKPHVFLPSQCGHYIIDYFPVGFTDKQLEQERQYLHTILNLPLDRPVFRKSNIFSFPHERGPYLIDVHESVTLPGMEATMIGIVPGHYQYRHYMQDNFDDKNWGCAYRSFQTIWSWFLLNGYTEKPVPSHREIQQALVDVGDKQADFVGSRRWVGSLELSFCLSHLADITSKILSVTTGDEMGQKARELIHHFKTQGTPVMIGGGVLAHTILGVAYNEENGETKFLVLDPHYTGEENLKTIIDKGWCGWKPVSFWDKTAFYNMMLPLKPNVY